MAEDNEIDLQEGEIITKIEMIDEVHCPRFGFLLGKVVLTHLVINSLGGLE